MTTSDKILQYIAKNGRASGKEITEYLKDISSRAVRKQLKNLLDKDILTKVGRPPKVYYLLATKKETPTIVSVDRAISRIINDRYLFISPTGQAKSGWEGFIAWCEKTKQDPIKTAYEYIRTLKKYDRFRKDNFIDGMTKMQQTFGQVYVDKLFYLDFYSIERFGKTKLGQMLLYAKQSQNKDLMRELIDGIHPRVTAIVRKFNIDGVLFIPPTVRREVQFMKELENRLRLPLRTVTVGKVRTDIVVPQKTLTKLVDRIENARHTIIVEDKKSYKNILLVDDAVGSGATINETAKQIKKKELCRGKIIGLAITGSFKGFDVISEV